MFKFIEDGIKRFRNFFGGLPLGKSKGLDDKVREVHEVLQNIDLYLEQEEWSKLLVYIAQNIPAKAYLYYLNGSEMSSEEEDFFLVYEKKLEEIYVRIKRELTNAKTALTKDEFRRYKKELLQIWMDFDFSMALPLREELAIQILEQGTTGLRWVAFCIPYLKNYQGKISPNFTSALQEFSAINIGKSSLGKIENRTSILQDHSEKIILNTQLILSGKQEYNWAHLNLARSILTEENLEFYLNETSADTKENTHHLLEWHLEKANIDEMDLSAFDVVLLAHVEAKRGNFNRVLDVFEQSRGALPEDLTLNYNTLLAIANGKLALAGAERADKDKAIEIFTELHQKEQLSNNNKFLLCQLLLSKEGKELDVKEIFEELTLEKLEAKKEEVIHCAWQVKSYAKIQNYLEEGLFEEKDSIELLSRLCEIYRFHRNQFIKAEDLMGRIKQIQPEHPWAIVQRANKLIGQNQVKPALNLLGKLPADDIWVQEKHLIRGRTFLSEKNIFQAKEQLAKITSTKRTDFQYLSAVTRANEKNYSAAMEIINGISEQDIFTESILKLNGLLLMAMGDYTKADHLFKGLENPDFNITKSWICLHQQKYTKGLKLIEQEDSNEAIYLKAILQDQSGNLQVASQFYKEFLRKSFVKDKYFTPAWIRFADLTIQTESQEDAPFILLKKELIPLLSKEQRLNLLLLNKSWEKLIELLIEEGETTDPNNLIYAYQQYLLECVVSKKWKKAEELLDKLLALDQEVKGFRDYVLQSQLFEDIQSFDKKINYNKYKSIKNEMIQKVLWVHQFIQGKMSHEILMQKLGKWLEKNPDQPKVLFVVLIVAMMGEDEEEVIEIAEQLIVLLPKIKEKNLELLVRTFIGISMNKEQHIPLEKIFNDKTIIDKQLPVVPQVFWHRLVQLYADKNIKKSIQILEEILNDNTIPQAEKIILYTKQAFNQISKKQTMLALENLEKATQF